MAGMNPIYGNGRNMSKDPGLHSAIEGGVVVPAEVRGTRSADAHFRRSKPKAHASGFRIAMWARIRTVAGRLKGRRRANMPLLRRARRAGDFRIQCRNGRAQAFGDYFGVVLQGCLGVAVPQVTLHIFNACVVLNVR